MRPEQKRSIGVRESEDEPFFDALDGTGWRLETDFGRTLVQMRKAGVSARLIYATVKLGRAVTMSAFTELSASELEVWNKALEEYDAGLAGRLFAA
ncbi:hypothetical protein MON41_23820 [Roseomonas vastitatis]|uniref:Uncharacterized protein n=1 Tax=Teichococcus vastitatis TaxID=2307076 RepID=A0ABS9WDD0_9PROT|nr:hypothetical protein [Pseudoroseomonas vastitatis]